MIDLRLGDCLEVLRTLPDCSVDSVVTDPPYGLSFMGKRWDYDVPAVEVWAECLRVLKPGGHLLAFAGTRTQHRMAVRIEDAGFEIRDMIAWVYGSGFPKSLDVSKAIDNAAGAVREVVGPATVGGKGQGNAYGTITRAPATAPATAPAMAWQGWGTAIKPALEPITVARKPLIGTVAENVLAHGTGAINVDGCRVGWVSDTDKASGRPASFPKAHNGIDEQAFKIADRSHRDPVAEQNTIGRFPANLIHDGSDEVVGLFPETGASSATAKNNRPSENIAMASSNYGHVSYGHDDNGGSAARFFYCAKASKADRDEGCDALPFRKSAEMVDRDEDSPGIQSPRAGAGRKNGARNFHPTVKPTELMRYLCRLVTQPGGIVLDPFMGSGSTGKGAMAEGFRFIGIERDPDYFKIAEARVASGIPRQPSLF
jgi:site-specific DNA-methyltransferase (adenine-specific)